MIYPDAVSVYRYDCCWCDGTAAQRLAHAGTGTGFGNGTAVEVLHSHVNETGFWM